MDFRKNIEDKYEKALNQIKNKGKTIRHKASD